MISRNKLITVCFFFVLVVGIVFFRASRPLVISADTTFGGDYVLDKKAVVVGDAKLVVDGNLEVAKALSCKDGALTIEVRGDLKITNRIECNRPEDVPAGDTGAAVTIVVGGSVDLGAQGTIVSNGHVQVIGQNGRIAKTVDDFKALYEEAGRNSGVGPRIGPINPLGTGSAPDERALAELERVNVPAPSGAGLVLLPVAHAQAPATVVVGGRVAVGTPPKGVRQVVVFDFPDAREVQVRDLELTGPDGRKGEDDKGSSCNARGKNGEDAFRMLLRAPAIDIGNFTLTLGNGGAGGDAETKTDCDPGVATGGNGGNAGNFKINGESSLKVTGQFLVNPGRGGNGGNATAYGKDGDPGKKGGDARATGGDGAHNKKALTVAGAVQGSANVQIGSAFGGNGGLATVKPGKGGDGQGCGDKGGDGGKATGFGGKGGNASIAVGGQAVRAPGAQDTGGNGGNVVATGAAGGNGGTGNTNCPGGNGGKGGDASAFEGKGGNGTHANGADGTVLDETGGKGGNGGDGCGPGQEGKGGKGNPDGADGADGKNLCVPPTPTPTPTSVTQPPPQTQTPAPTPRKETRVIKAIRYSGKYLPVDQLIIEAESGCDGGQPHWHAAQGVVKATDGSLVPDPGPQCGYGKQSQVPVMDVEVDAGFQSGF